MDGKYRRFIKMLKQLSINVPLVEALEQMPGYAKFMKDLVIKKRSVTFDFEVHIILRRPFLASGRALVDMEKGQMTFRLNNEDATFNICRTMRQRGELQISICHIPQRKYEEGD